MADLDDYFVNRAAAVRFSWSLYHRSLERSSRDYLCRAAADRPGGRVLVVGCGLMHERGFVPGSLAYTVADIDARAVESVLSAGDSRIVAARLLKAEEDLRTLGETLDGIYAKEVTEHMVHWKRYLRCLRAALTPGQRFWLRTPNHGEPWLPYLEATALELVARWSGYSRRNLHPTRLWRGILKKAPEDAQFDDVEAQPVSRRLALVATGRR